MDTKRVSTDLSDKKPQERKYNSVSRKDHTALKPKEDLSVKSISIKDYPEENVESKRDTIMYKKANSTDKLFNSIIDKPPEKKETFIEKSKEIKDTQTEQIILQEKKEVLIEKGKEITDDIVIPESQNEPAECIPLRQKLVNLHDEKKKKAVEKEDYELALFYKKQINSVEKQINFINLTRKVNAETGGEKNICSLDETLFSHEKKIQILLLNHH